MFRMDLLAFLSGSDKAGKMSKLLTARASRKNFPSKRQRRNCPTAVSTIVKKGKERAVMR